MYENVEDIDLLAGIWVERPINGGYVPSTFYCLVIDQMRRNTVSDRHWYERPNRPDAFTIRKYYQSYNTSDHYIMDFQLMYWDWKCL